MARQNGGSDRSERSGETIRASQSALTSGTPGNPDPSGVVVSGVRGRAGLDADDLVERARIGDVAAYEQLVEQLQGVAFRAAYLITRDAGEAEDAAQEAFVKAFRALGRFRPGAPFRPWLLRIVTNEARNRRKAAARREHLALRVAADPSAPGWTEADEPPLADRAAVLSAVGRLSEEDQTIISYRYFLDLSEAEMAEALSCPRGTVKSRLARAIARLRAELLAGDSRMAISRG